MEYYLQYNYLTSAAVAVGCVCVAIHLTRRSRNRYMGNDFDYLQINIIKTEEACDEAVKELRRRCSVHRALGFDCEWVTENGKRNPVALLQLSSIDGYCGLFRLNYMKTFPQTLKDLLEDETVYKMGVAAADDAGYLFGDYGVVLRSTLDLRHIAKVCGFPSGGLASLANSLLGIALDKSWRVRCCNWEAEQLTRREMQYAAVDAHVAIKIFVRMFNRHRGNGLWAWVAQSRQDVAESVDEMCRRYANMRFNQFAERKDNGPKKLRPNKTMSVTRRMYPRMARSKPLYHNCFMHAPDGELLCTCDDKKARWYVEKELADITSESPLRVRLRFEPAGRCVGEVGRYYQLTKENICVVCARDNNCIRKNVVPREYRKYFPEIMKDHSSHDIVLLCGDCHRTSNIADQSLRIRLAVTCAAPLPARDHVRSCEDPAIKKIRSAARALFYQTQKHVLPDDRRKELEDILLQHYPDHAEITEDLLQEASHMQILVENEGYESHGLRVMEFYKKVDGGLLKLEQIWRENFLATMRPKYLPELWSTRHNEERLRLKWDEGRLTEEELQTIGIYWTKTEQQSDRTSVVLNGLSPADE